MSYLKVLSDPASQWYLAGTVFHCLARATMAPASKTPNPKRWLNSKPTPFMFQWNLPLESNNEFLLEVHPDKQGPGRSEACIKYG